jgi:putative DNA primase/helicase
MQRLLGYGITGLAIHHLFIILFGAGRNGKGTLLETIRAVLGDYAFKTESELLLEQKSARMAGSPNSGVLSLRGRRIVWASETSDGRRLNAGRLKELVGGDTLNARPIFGKHHVQFEPSHLLLLLTNNKPSAPASDYALWQRVNLIPFEKAFVSEPKAPNEYKADPYLCEKLKDEASGILAWLVKGCLAWQREDLNPPDIVKAATNEYRSDEDTIGHFIEERCSLNADYQVRAGELYKAWKAWAEASGVTYLSGKRFGMEIKKRRFDSYKDKHGTYYIGISLAGDG